MKYDPQAPKPPRASEPVQVYLHRPDQDRLKRLTERLGTNKSDVLRRGLEALERQVTDPADHPVLRIIGLGSSSGPADTELRDAMDPAREHDRVLADSEFDSWSGGADHGEDGADGS